MKKVVLFLLSIFTVLFLISCGSKPAAEETKPAAPTVEDVVDVVETTEIDNTDLAAFLAKIKNAYLPNS